MIGAGMTLLRNHQFMLLEGTEAASQESRKTYEMDTRFRVLALCFGQYEILGEVVPIAEIEEFCVTNKTMSYEDYRDCRDLDLTVEIFLNDAISLRSLFPSGDVSRKHSSVGILIERDLQ